jgi:hypothetical protein
MTLVAERLEALIVARAHALAAGQPVGELIKPLARFAPGELTAGAWRDRLTEVVAGLRARDVLDADHRLRDDGELARRIGPGAPRSWAELSDRVLPGLALGIAADDGKLRARLVGRDAWAAAIVGRALGLWIDGPPPSLAALCDALVWREHGLASKPKRCPPELRALYVQRRLGSEAGVPERGVRLLAAREVGAPRPELRALRDALVRCWLAGRVIGAASPGDGRDTMGAMPDRSPPLDRETPDASGGGHDDPPGDGGVLRAAGAAAAPGEAPASFADGVLRAAGAAAAQGGPPASFANGALLRTAGAAAAPGGPPASFADDVLRAAGAAAVPGGPPASFADDVLRGAAGAAAAPGGPPASFADDVLRAAGAATEGRFGDRKVFVSALWEQLRREPRWAELALAELKARLLAAHRAGELTLARADLVAAMDPELVAASEIAADGASFHFVIKEPAP